MTFFVAASTVIQRNYFTYRSTLFKLWQHVLQFIGVSKSEPDAAGAAGQLSSCSSETSFYWL
jgi:hypothetical protein